MPEPRATLLAMVPLARHPVAALRAVLGWTDDTVTTVAQLPGRISALVDEIDALTRRIGAVTDRVDGVLDQVDEAVEQAVGVLSGATPVVAQAAAVAGRADVLVGEVTGAGRSATALVERFEPVALRLAPLAERLAAGVSAAEVDAVIRLVNEVPVFASRMDAEVIPVLTTLDRVGPDVRDLLDALRDVQHTLSGLPGFTMFRRRAEREG